MELEIQCGEFWINRKDFPNTLFGEIMWDIAYCNPENCANKKAFMELLEQTTKEILEKAKIIILE